MKATLLAHPQVYLTEKQYKCHSVDKDMLICDHL